MGVARHRLRSSPLRRANDGERLEGPARLPAHGPVPVSIAALGAAP
jgi:hypothetical protein